MGENTTLCMGINCSGADVVLTSVAPTDAAATAGVQTASVIIIFLASFIANGTVFVVFYCKPSLLTLSNRLVLNLAISNFLLTILILPFIVVASVTQTWHLGVTWCRLSGFATTLLFAACIFTLLVISVDRYYAVIRPLHYSIHITSRRLCCFLAAIWGSACVIAAPPLVGWNRITYQADKNLCTVDWRSQSAADRAYTYTFLVVCFCLPLAVMAWVYVRIFRAAQSTSARARRNSTEVGLVQHAVGNGALQAAHARRPTLQLRRGSTSVGSGRGLFLLHKDDHKAAKTGLIVMTAFVVCWLPFFTLIAVEASAGDDAARHLPGWLGSAAVWTAFCGCALNPLVYVFRSKAIIHECRRRLPCRDRRSDAFPDRYGIYRDSTSNSGRPSNASSVFLTPNVSSASISQTVAPTTSILYERDESKGNVSTSTLQEAT
ncbi:G_PROTEIN_RECEP_F1_2 domain-containing protein [Lamellibrachia satsuma]|nr:G_PROTEIN_RECEP_F1_2 domain-containing protein [Lamellibrachia satsuma]